MKPISKWLMILGTMLILSSCDQSVIYNPSDTLTSIPLIEIIIDEDEYYHLLQNKTTRAEVPAKIIYMGETNTGLVRSSGGGSRLHPRWSFRIELNNGAEIDGLDIFSLSSQSLDPTMIHTTIVTRLYELRGIPVSQNKHVFVKINNRDEGLYLKIERINEEFFQRRNIPAFEIFKAGLDSDFSFNSDQHPIFTYEKKLPKDNNYSHFFEYLNAIDTCDISTLEQSLEYYMEIDNYIIYHAMSSITNNSDAFKNNYFLLRESAQDPYKFFPWDFDRSFDLHHDVGLAGENTLFNKIIENQNVKNKYKEELQLLLENYFREDIIFPVIDSTAVHISDAYNIDPFLGGGGYNLDFQVNELKSYISNRIIYFRNHIREY